MKLFILEKVIFDPRSLKYKMGKEIYDYFVKKDIEIVKTSLNNIMKNIDGKTENQIISHAKKTLVVTIKKGITLTECRPSADYEFSVVSNCPGVCEYCYLQAKKTHKPYVKVFVNIEEILGNLNIYMSKSDKKPFQNLRNTFYNWLTKIS